MLKKILILNGSPKKNGNTDQLVSWFIQGIPVKKAAVETIRAVTVGSKVNGCISCRICQKKKAYACVICDDVSIVLAKMAQADMIVFASPLYFYGPSAQLKLIIDRMFSLYKWDNSTDTFTSPLRGKTMVLLLSAYENIGLKIVEKSFKLIADYSEMRFYSLLVPGAGESGDIEQVKGIRKRTAAFAVKLFSK
jgi:multimeric flavodoxin WrbA